MKTKWERARFAALIAAIIAGVIFMASPTLKTKGYFAFVRAWNAHYPFSSGKTLPYSAAWVFGEFVPVWLEVEPGVTMRLDPFDMVTQTILTRGAWEPATWQEMQAHIPEGGTFIDVGAHVGWYSLKAAKKVGPHGRVIAVEPNPETIPSLKENIRANHDEAIIAVAPVACASSESVLTLYAAPRENTGESSLSKTNASQEGKPTASYQVRARPLDDIVSDAHLSGVDFLKVDVEGAELLVLKGAATTLDRFHPVVVMELVDSQLKSMGTSEEEVVAFMRLHGYQRNHAYEQNVEFTPMPRNGQ